MLAAANENEMEGIIAKELDSRYEPGKRTGKWLKIKTINRQELVIGGWIPEKNIVERGVGALLTGYYTEGKLLFAGKVGTGFTDKEKLELRAKLEKISRTTNPFSEKVAYKNALFVEPVLVAEFEFREWTPTGRLRHPSYKGLRNDKDPLQVQLEQ
jgi:bifunctional non-homologous end joining protein LigD